MPAAPLPFTLAPAAPPRARLLAALAGIAATIAIGMAAPAPLLAAAAFGLDPIVLAGLGVVLWIGFVVAQLVRVTVARVSAVQAALPVSFASALLLPGLGAAAFGVPLALAVLLVATGGASLGAFVALRPRAANDNAPVADWLTAPSSSPRRPARHP